MKLSSQDTYYLVEGYKDFLEYCGGHLTCDDCPMNKVKQAFASKVDINTSHFCEIPYVLNYIRKQEKKNAKQGANAQVSLDMPAWYRVTSKPLLRKFLERVEELGLELSEAEIGYCYLEQKRLGINFCIYICQELRVCDLDECSCSNSPIIFYNGRK